MIPRIIHQTAKTAAIPEQWQPLQAIVRRTYPDWEYRLWTDADNLALVQRSYPSLVPMYQNLARPIMRVDLIRYLIMDQIGGLYLDLDYEFLRAFDFTTHSLVLPRESADEEPVFLGNAVFASIPGHPFWKAVIADLSANPPSRYREVAEEEVINLTGPGFLTRIYRRQFQADSSILIPPQLAFNPPIPSTPADYAARKADGQSFGIHYCHGTWRALTTGERIRERLARGWRTVKRMFERTPHG